jgi:hypothetical protein
MKFPFFEEYIKITESIDTDAVRFGIWKKYIKHSYEVNEDVGISGAQDKPDPNRAKVAAMSNEDAISKAEKIMQMCKLKILNHFEWFKPYLDIMPPIGRIGAGSVGPDGIGTMSTSGSAIYYCPKFVVLSYENAKTDFKLSEEKKKLGALKANMTGSKWYSDYACFVILHEIMHNSLKHFMRQNVEIDSEYLSKSDIHYLWNIAMDYEINRILKGELTAEITMFPGGVDLEEGPFEVPEDEKDFFRTQTCETIFWRLFDQLEEKKKKQKEEKEESQSDQQEDQEDKGEELSIGDIIQDNSTGEYGRVTSVDDDDVEWDVISKEEAMAELYPDDPTKLSSNDFDIIGDSDDLDKDKLDDLLKELDL